MGKIFSELIVLVHPLYDLVFGENYEQSIIKNNFNPNIKKIKSKEKKSFSQLKKSLGIYGDFLNRQTDENKLIIVYKPNLKRFFSNSHKREYNKNIKIYDVLLNKFISYFKKKFSNRFYVSSFDPNEPSSDLFLSKKLQNQLKSEININLLGEYYTKYLSSTYGCVPTWEQYLNKKLENIGVKVNESKIISSKTLAFNDPKFKEDGFRDKLIRGHERRKIQNKKKKDKLKINKKIR
jgi:hypothetical protein